MNVSDGAPADKRTSPAAPAEELIEIAQVFDDYSSQRGPHGISTWRHELARWLATLNPGRTQQEYAKAVGYFFETPGVSANLDELSYDLLLAYRGALALRATPHTDNGRKSSRGRWMKAQEPRLLAQQTATALPPGNENGGSHAQQRRDADLRSPLSPATVNLRLTALRQFLIHCVQTGSLHHLTQDQIRAALRRLRVERRRPYQVLAEEDWAAFLEAAEYPIKHREAWNEAHDTEPWRARVSQRGPWGVPRALRARQLAEQAAGTTMSEDMHPESHLVRSRAGLTGARTAQRDHALVALALATGLRAVELAELNVGDVVREWHDGMAEWWLVLPDAKTKGQHGGRTLPLAGSLMQTLLDYLTSTGRRWDRGADRETPLFLSQSHRSLSTHVGPHGPTAKGPVYRRLSPQQIRCIVDRVETQWLAMRANTMGEAEGENRRISPHALRHSTAIALLEGNQDDGRPPASVEHVRGWLGHLDIRTTQGYLAHLDARKHRRPFTLAPTATEHASSHSERDRADPSESAPGNDDPAS